MDILLVGGTWDHQNGKSSKTVAKLSKHLRCCAWNGGNINLLKECVQNVHRLPLGTILIWMPNISNDEEKMLPLIKQKNPTLTLVTSKKIHPKYGVEGFSISDMLGRMLNAHAVLGFMIYSDNEGEYAFTLVDPLGNCYCAGYPTEPFAEKLKERLEFLSETQRVRSKYLGSLPAPVKVNGGFLEVVRSLSERFNEYATAVNPNRLFGNASTRCALGFPAQREDSKILVTRRNIDKSSLDEDGFVQVVTCTDGSVGYFGDHKPSVDTPIQLRLFEAFPQINYIIHGHCYVKGGVPTSNKVPCGDIREVDEIIRLFRHFKNQEEIRINLHGHGCLLLGSAYNWMKDVELVERNIPEF